MKKVSLEKTEGIQSWKDSDFSLSYDLHSNSQFLLFSSKKLFSWVRNNDKQSNRENMESIRMSPKSLFGKICVFCHFLWIRLSQATNKLCRMTKVFNNARISPERELKCLSGVFIHQTRSGAHCVPLTKELLVATWPWGHGAPNSPLILSHLILSALPWGSYHQYPYSSYRWRNWDT